MKIQVRVHIRSPGMKGIHAWDSVLCEVGIEVEERLELEHKNDLFEMSSIDVYLPVYDNSVTIDCKSVVKIQRNPTVYYNTPCFSGKCSGM